MGGFSMSTNQVQQTISLNQNANMHCQPAYYKGSLNEFIYIWPENDVLLAYPFNRSTNLLDVSHSLFSTVSWPTGQSGAVLSVSSIGDTPLHAAACNGAVDCLLMLLQYGIDPRYTNTRGDAPTHFSFFHSPALSFSLYLTLSLSLSFPPLTINLSLPSLSLSLSLSY